MCLAVLDLMPRSLRPRPNRGEHRVLTFPAAPAQNTALFTLRHLSCGQCYLFWQILYHLQYEHRLRLDKFAQVLSVRKGKLPWIGEGGEA